MMDFKNHPQYWYAQNVHTFKQCHLNYYSNNSYVTTRNITNIFLRDQRRLLLSAWVDLGTQLQKFATVRPDVTVVTATNNRRDSLIQLYQSILSQRERLSRKVAWVIIDNGSTDGTTEFVLNMKKYDRSIFFLSYNTAFEYASPARNRGLMFVQLALAHTYGERYVCVVDSDDELHNEFSLFELYKTAQQNPNAPLVHGFTVCYYENRGLTVVNSIPRFINNGFPAVTMMKDEFDTGPQILAALIPVKYLGWFYYPNEFTFEDDTLNRKILCWSKKKELKQAAIDYPTTVKRFHFHSLSRRNAQIGPQNIEAALGPAVVKGIQAQVVLGLLHLRDYFTQEDF